MRIVTRPDFDGIVCAVLLKEADRTLTEIVWMEPNEIQSGKADILKGDVLANLPWHPNAGLWFDHHISNQPRSKVPGLFDIAPSAAGLVYTYFKQQGRLDNRFDELVYQTDCIDSADLTRDQVARPEDYPYVLISMTIKNIDYQDTAYWHRLVEMLRNKAIEEILKDAEVSARCEEVVRENQAFAGHLEAHTQILDHVSVTDFRGVDPVPSGNRFLTYSLFPQTNASVRIRFKDSTRAQVLISVGHSIFNRTCKVNVGKLLSRFGGGGHAGAGGCTLAAEGAQEQIDTIIGILRANHDPEAG